MILYFIHFAIMSLFMSISMISIRPNVKMLTTDHELASSRSSKSDLQDLQDQTRKSSKLEAIISSLLKSRLGLLLDTRHATSDLGWTVAPGSEVRFSDTLF